MITLGIETSCDETALALIESRTDSAGQLCVRVIDSLVHSQAELHSAYGGVHPNLAKREHGKNLIPLLHKLLIGAELKTRATIGDSEFGAALESFKAEIAQSNPELFQTFSAAHFLKNIPSIDRIAVTEGPGLEPALWVGINAARMLGKLWNITVVPVNHMEGHVIGSLLASDAARGDWQTLKPIEFPALALLISGGHTELVRVDPDFKYTILGQTKDDAVGEAFDKVARLLGLPYPGGPHISKLAHEAEEQKNATSVKLPRPMIKSGDLDFSFSGLKTAVLYAVRAHADASGLVSEEFKKGLALEFEMAVTETLDTKLRSAIESSSAKTLIVGGGVSANRRLRERFQKTADEFGLTLYLPSRHISGDNALMIALAAAIHSSKPTGPLKADGTLRLGNAR